MSNLVAFHDQVLEFIKTDSFALKIGDTYSLDILAAEFERFWRNKISLDLSTWLLQDEQTHFKLTQSQFYQLFKEIGKEID